MHTTDYIFYKTRGTFRFPHIAPEKIVTTLPMINGLKNMIKKFETSSLWNLTEGRKQLLSLQKKMCPRQSRKRRAVVSEALFHGKLFDSLENCSIVCYTCESGAYNFTKKSCIVVHAKLPIFRSCILLTCVYDNERPYDILWRDEAHFYLQGYFSIHNCRIWATKIHSVLCQKLFFLQM